MIYCDECNGTNVVKYGRRWRKIPNNGRRRDVQQYQCKDCGKIFKVIQEGENNGTKS